MPPTLVNVQELPRVVQVLLVERRGQEHEGEAGAYLQNIELLLTTSSMMNGMLWLGGWYLMICCLLEGVVDGPDAPPQLLHVGGDAPTEPAKTVVRARTVQKTTLVRLGRH